MTHDVGQRLLQNAKQANGLDVRQGRQVVRHLHQTRYLCTRLKALGLPLNRRADTRIENRRTQGGGHIAHQLEQVGDQALHAVEAILQPAVQLAIRQLAHRGFQLKHRQYLAQFVVYFAGDAGFFFFAHTFQVCRQLTQLTTGFAQRQLDAFTLADIPDDAVPHHQTVLQATGNGLDIGPTLLTVAGQNPALPMPVAVGLQCGSLAQVVAEQVIGVHQAANPTARLHQCAGRITN